MRKIKEFIQGWINVQDEMIRFESLLFSRKFIICFICEPILFSVVLINSIFRRLDIFQISELLYILFEISYKYGNIVYYNFYNILCIMSNRGFYISDNFNDYNSCKKVNNCGNDEVSMQSPLDVFSVIYDNSINYFSNSIIINIFINFVLILLIFRVILFSNKRIENFDNTILKYIYFFFWDLFKNLVSNIRLERFFMFIFSFFACILFLNFGGFSFYELSLTSHICVTFFFSLFVFSNYVSNMIINFNHSFYLKFVQQGSIFLVPFLFVIEIISFIVRPFSLSIRLFANIMSGHILMHMFFSTFIFSYKLYFWLSFIIFLLCTFVFFMELFVSFIQSYIFIILLLIYSTDMISIHSG